MEEMMRFDGVIHWCFLISVFIFIVGLSWVTIRVLLPLHRLAKLAAEATDSNLPDFAAPSGGIREIEQLRRALYEMTARIQAGQAREISYRNALAESQERERMRFAREIHDDTIQSLVLVSHNLERASQAVNGSDRGDIPQYLKVARSQLVTTIDTLRRMIANLRPSVLEDLGLISALESLCEEHPSLDFRVSGVVYPLERAQELTIFRTAQEAIRNAEQHAQASRISAKLIYSPVAIRLEVHDDGKGFHVPQQLQEFVAHGHYGLIGIRERILHSGGQLSVTSQERRGTCIVATFQNLRLETASA